MAGGIVAISFHTTTLGQGLALKEAPVQPSLDGVGCNGLQGSTDLRPCVAV